MGLRALEGGACVHRRLRVLLMAKLPTCVSGRPVRCDFPSAHGPHSRAWLPYPFAGQQASGIGRRLVRIVAPLLAVEIDVKLIAVQRRPASIHFLVVALLVLAATSWAQTRP